MSELFGNTHLELLDRQITSWLMTMMERNATIVAVDRGEPDEYRWYVRMHGEEKEFTTVWFTLGQRTLRFETYVMPAPEENAEQLYEHVLRRNESLVGVHTKNKASEPDSKSADTRNITTAPNVSYNHPPSVAPKAGPKPLNTPLYKP